MPCSTSFYFYAPFASFGAHSPCPGLRRQIDIFMLARNRKLATSISLSQGLAPWSVPAAGSSDNLQVVMLSALTLTSRTSLENSVFLRDNGFQRKISQKSSTHACATLIKIPSFLTVLFSTFVEVFIESWKAKHTDLFVYIHITAPFLNAQMFMWFTPGRIFCN